MPTPERIERFNRVARFRLRDVTLVLEDIHDPHNAGAILRIAEGLGIAAVHFLFLQESPYNPRRATRGTAMSAQKWLELFVWCSREELLARLKMQGFASRGLVAPDDGGIDLWRHDWRQGKIAFWLGNEHHGLAPETCRALDGLTTIPMWGMVRSFNVSVAAAVALAEAVRQRRYGAPLVSGA
ncbi:MAG: tRNA (guanosine(18)-2'-O)-methyltransferase [Candidatus Parcubacteria bacterium]|nr:MAG: tRNA (guanosine(18)-2'-O)-methyltransferase [Candidatus Parcubacteria bacterium]